MENITASELAGFGVGTLLFCATIAAPKVDSFIAASQRRSLGMCKRCGDLKMIACSRCKGVGLVREGPIIFSVFEDINPFGGGPARVGSISCINCRGRGQKCCPECSKLP